MKDRDRIIEENTGLVHACATRFSGRGIEYEDLYAGGCIGLIKAADNFDESLGFRFSTYAVPVILGEIKRMFRDGGSVKVSRSLKELSLKVSRVISEFEKLNGTAPTISQISEILCISKEQVSEAMEASRYPLSLSLSNEEEDAQYDVAVPCEEERLTEKLTLHQVIDELSENDKMLIHLRYFGNKTQTETACVLGMTQVQVSRREKKILSLLREKMTV